MTTLFDIVLSLFKGNQRKYRLFLACNVLAIGILFSLRLLSDHPMINDPGIVDPMISSNIFAPNLLMHVFEIFFIPYTLILLNKQIGKNYGILMSFGLSERQFVSCILMENALLIVVSVTGGIAAGLALEAGLILMISHQLHLRTVVFSLNMESCYQTLVFLMVIYAASVLAIIISVTRKRIIKIITDERRAEQKKGYQSLFTAGLVCFFLSLLSSYCFYERTGGNILLLGIVLSYIGLVLICCNADFLIRKWREKWLFLVSDYEYYHKTNINLSLMLIALYGALLFMNTLSSVTESSLKNDVTNYYPYDLVFTQDITDRTDMTRMMEQYGVEVEYRSEIPYFYAEGYSVFGVDDVNRETGELFQIPKGSFLYVRSVVLHDGYIHEKGYVPEQIIIKKENFERYADIDRLLFCRGGGITDSIILINQEDYERIVSGTSFEKSLRLFRFKSTGRQEGLADSIEKLTGSDVVSYYEADTRAAQSAALLYLLMRYISAVILASAIIAIHYKIESERESDACKYQLLIAIGADRDFIQRCIRGKLIAAVIFPLIVSTVWMVIISYINTFSYDHQMIAVCRCLETGLALGCFLYVICYISKNNYNTL